MALQANSSAINTPDYGSTFYYLALFVMLVIVRYFKLKKKSADKDGMDRRDIFCVGLEVVYTVSGLVVLLLDALKDYQAFIIMFYMIVFFVMTSIEGMEEKFSKWTVFAVNIFILTLAVSMTFYYFQVLEPANKALRNAPKTGSMGELISFRVSIPYDDLSLRELVGSNRVGDRKFVFSTTVEAFTASEAKNSAMKKFELEIFPIRPQQIGKDELPKRPSLITEKREITAEALTK